MPTNIMVDLFFYVGHIMLLHGILIMIGYQCVCVCLFKYVYAYLSITYVKLK